MYDLFSEPIGQLLLSNKQMKLIMFNPDKQELVEWINSLNIAKQSKIY